MHLFSVLPLLSVTVRGSACKKKSRIGIPGMFLFGNSFEPGVIFEKQAD